jgi:hypothetical protein
LRSNSLRWMISREANSSDRDSAHDEVTADLLTQRIQVHEKTARMLRSLLAELQCDPATSHLPIHGPSVSRQAKASQCSEDWHLSYRLKV